MIQIDADPPAADVGPLRPCPFCGGAAALERDPLLDESLRVACGNGACRVGPKTEYLLACFVDELRAAWNARPEADDGDAAATTAAGSRHPALLRARRFP